jgi:hypothetical protein
MLILGLFTRSAAMLAVVMVVAIKSAKWGDVDLLETLLGFEEALFRRLHVARHRRSRQLLDRLLVNAAGTARNHLIPQSCDSAPKAEPGFPARVAVETPASRSRHETRPHRRLRSPPCGVAIVCRRTARME